MSANWPVGACRGNARSMRCESLPPHIAGDAAAATTHSIRFRRFAVLPGERRLLCNGSPVEIGGRAFDLLLILLQFRGTLVTKERILSYVWPSTIVDESNLRFQMASLRRVLGADRDVIKTIPRRGYLFLTEKSGDGMDEQTSPVRPVIGGRGQGRRVKRGAVPLVAVIDDDEATREALYGLLKSVGWHVEIFASVQSFMSRPSTSVPDCLVLDVWMPGRSGLDFQSELVAIGQTLPVIFISGRADIPMSVRAMKAGALEFLTKPVRHEELLAAISSAVAPGVAANE